MDIEIRINDKPAYSLMIKHKAKRIALEYGRKIDYWFTHDGQWPSEIVE